MPTVPGAFQTTSIIQNQTTGVVDYLKYTGNQLVASSAHDYGLGSDWKIVASGYFGQSENPQLVAQSQSSGKLDFLSIDSSGNLTASFMTSYSVPQVHGAGFFGSASNARGPQLVSQLADGSIDILGFDQNYNFVASDLVADSKGLPTLVGVGGQYYGSGGPQFQSLGADNASILTQLPDGTLDAIGISGNFSDGDLSVVSSFLLSQTKGSGKAYATNVSVPDNFNIGGDNSQEGVQVFTQASNGYGALYLDSGYGDTGTQGALYASNLLPSYAGWDVVDGADVLYSIFRPNRS